MGISRDSWRRTDNYLPSSVHPHLRLPSHMNRYNIIHPSRHQKATRSPDPHHDPKTHGYEKCGHQNEERDADPEERKEERRDEGEGEHADCEREEEGKGCEGEEELDCEECLKSLFVSY